MKTFRCKLLALVDAINIQPVQSFPVPHGLRAKVQMFEDHDRYGSAAGGVTITSALKSIDFERGIIVTQNNLYLFKV